MALKSVASYCSRVAQTATDFADASHSKSAKSVTTTVSYGIFSSENAYPCTVTSRIHFLTESNRRIVEMEKLCYDTCGYNCSAGLHTSCADLLNSYG